MAYVDLNPVRTAIAETPETSEHTSVKARIASLKKTRVTPSNMFPFAGNPRENMPDGLPFRLMDYLELVDWTGWQGRDDKRGHIDGQEPDILKHSVAEDVQRIKASSMVPKDIPIYDYVFDCETGELIEVEEVKKAGVAV